MLRNREGFTLIELLIVVVIIGILAAIALPKFGQTRERAYYTTMTADLSNLRSAQEMYYQTSGQFTYANNLTDLEFSESAGVHIKLDGASDNLAWAATATHDALATTNGCSIAYGDIANSGASYPSSFGVTIDAQNEGRPVCDQ
ncbi:MAG: prepilin-type N-terminal cleavage/methylation domain-containing protein [Gemmatimonadota bacterium]